MFNATFIVWRESVEAILVITILHAWLAHEPERGHAMAWLWGGVAGGVLLALGLGGALLFVQDELTGNALDLFQVGMMLFAAALITQMVLWMHRHGRRLKSELEQQAAGALRRSQWWGVALLAAIAVGREGAETVIFLYGLTFERGTPLLPTWLAAAGLGLGAAGLTAWVLNHGSRVLSWKLFFRVTEVLLFLLAGSLVIAGVEKLIGLDLLPALIDPLWNTRGVLGDNRGVGGLLAAFVGYRATPSLTELIAYGLYWAVVATLLRIYATPHRPAELRT
jgi:high-affinity iron transporter